MAKFEFYLPEKGTEVFIIANGKVTKTTLTGQAYACFKDGKVSWVLYDTTTPDPTYSNLHVSVDMDNVFFSEEEALKHVAIVEP